MSTQRIEAADVQAIYPTSQELQPFIETATLLVSERLLGHYSEARLTEIERWLSAHLASTSAVSASSVGGGQVSEIRADEITVRYATGSGSGSATGSKYGDHVKLLDYKGILAQDLTGKIAKFSVH